MTDDRIRRFLQRTAGATTGLGPRSTFRPTHATQSPQPTPATELGTEGDYELAEILGRGGMGVVYRARQPRLDRTVAVKTIRPEIGSDAAVASFICEARVTGHLAHPNIVPVIDIGRSSVGDTFLAMKLVEGQSWEELLADDGPVAESLFMDLDDDTAFPDSALQDLPMRVGSELEPHLEIFLSVCNAIAFAHSRGFIHRDIKPTNVMLGEFGEVLVMDWGLAVDIADERREGRPSIVHKSEVKEPWGTPCYLAPEMAEGDGESLGPWTDVFLLGATLHEVVTRRPPHAGTNFKRILEAARTASPPSYPDEVPAELQGILQRAMAKDPMDRFPSVLALRDALRGFQKHGESTRLTEAARSAAHEAEALSAGTTDEVQRTRSYALFGSAIAGYEQALTLWHDNEAATSGARSARMAFARSALNAGDLALARAQLQPLPREDVGELNQQIHQEEMARRNSRRTTRRLRTGIAAACALVVVALGVLAARWDDIQRGRKEAEKARLEALLQEGFYELGEGSNTRATAAFQKILDTTDEPPREAVAGLALTQLRTGNLQDGWDLLDRYAPDIHDSRFGWIRAELMRFMGRHEESAALESELGEPGDALEFFILGVRDSLVGHRLEELGLAGNESALADAAVFYRRSLDALTRAMLYSESLRGLYLFNRAHAAGHCQDEDVVNECADLMTRRFPESPHAWFWTGFAYERLGGHGDETVHAYREALALDPDNARYRFCLGTALMPRDPGDAKRLLLQAYELKPDDAETLCNLGHVHTALGEYAEALEALQKGHALGRLRGDAWHYSSAQWVESAKRMVDLADRLLPAIERGEAGLPVEDPQAMILRELEAVARTRGRGVALTKAYQELLASAGPQTHPNLFLRAACAALIPAAVNPSQSTSLGYRQLASRWLRESLTRCRMAAEAGVLPRGVAALMITDSLADPGLDPIREGAGLDELPEAERAHWIERWDEARAIASALAD